MNRTTLPSMYLATYQDGGSIKNETLSDYISIPSEVKDINLSNCASTFTQVASTTIGAFIYCQDGNSSNPPKFAFSTDGNISLSSSYYK